MLHDLIDRYAVFGTGLLALPYFIYQCARML